MKVLIFGVGGMLGHKMYQIFKQNNIDTFGTLRSSTKKYNSYNVFEKDTIIDNLDIMNFSSVKKSIQKIKPNIVINCIAIIKHNLVKYPAEMILVNSVFPRKLYEFCSDLKSRLIHISTDGVFSGKKGNYSEESFPDVYDLYGLTKLIGEVTEENTLSIRTAVIGHELRHKRSLLEWIISQKNNTINGYVNAIFNGITNLELSEVILSIILKKPKLDGLLNIGGEKLSKYDFIKIVNEIYRLDIKINPSEKYFCDRSLDITKFTKLGFSIPPMKQMLKDLKDSL